ncbi:hypothetical protein ADUPG1_012348, partial [Aduncisulcus paluster]
MDEAIVVAYTENPKSKEKKKAFFEELKTSLDASTKAKTTTEFYDKLKSTKMTKEFTEESLFQYLQSFHKEAVDIVSFGSRDDLIRYFIKGLWPRRFADRVRNEIETKKISWETKGVKDEGEDDDE